MSLAYSIPDSGPTMTLEEWYVQCMRACVHELCVCAYLHESVCVCQPRSQAFSPQCLSLAALMWVYCKRQTLG